LARMSLSSFFSGIARTRIVMIASLAAMLANVAFSYMFIFGKFGFSAMGIRGAGYSMILGGTVGLMILLFAYFRRHNRKEYGVDASFRFDRILAGKLFRLGSSTGLEMFLNIVAFNAMVMLFHSLGPATATAATVLFNWDMVAFIPLVGIEISITSLVGRYMGARNPGQAHQAVMSGLKLGMIYSGVIFIFCAGFPGMLVGVFKPAAVNPVFIAAVPIAGFMVRFMSVYVLVEAMLCVFVGALRGAGDTFWAMRMSVFIHWLMVFVLALLLKVFHQSPQIGWLAVVFFFLLFSGIVFLRYKEGKWKKIRIVEPAAPLEILPGIGEV